MRQAISILFLTASLFAQQGPTYQIAPFAGTYQVPASVAANAAVFSQPGSVVADSSGNLYIADTENYVIRRLGTDGRVTVVAGNGTLATPGTPAGPQLGRVVALALHQNRYLYLSERTRIRRFDLNTSQLETVLIQAGDAVSLAVDAAGSVWFIDAAAGALRVVDPSGAVRVAVSGVNGGGGVAIDRTGNVYFVESIQDNRSRLRRILAFDPTNITTVAALDPMTLPKALAFDRESTTLYMADTVGHRIGRIDLATRSVGLLAGNSFPGFAGDSDRSQVYAPGGITVMPDGSIVFADTENLRIRRLQSTGEISTLAGRINSSGELVAATTALVGNPAAVKVDSRGNILITESFSCVVREVVAGGVIQTLLGRPGVCRTMPEGLTTLREVTFNRPTAAVRDPAGNLFIADRTGVWAILAKDRNARQIFRAEQVLDLELDPAGTSLYMVVNSLHIVSRFNIPMFVETGELLYEDVAGNNQPGFSGEGGPGYRAQMRSPTSIAFDAKGDLLVVDAGNERLRRVNIASNGILTVAILPGIQSVTADREGFIHVGFGSRIARLDASGPVTVAGNDTFGLGAESGNALQARFTEVRNMATLPDRSLLIADYRNHRVRRIQITVPPPPPGGGGGGGGGTGATNRPRVTRVQTSGNFGASATLAVGSWVEIYGENFATAIGTWSGADFQNGVAPSTLAGVRVLVNDKPCFLQLVSPTQINAILPGDLPLGEVGLQVESAGVRGDVVPVRVALRAPALLAPPAFRRDDRQYVAAQFADGAFAGPADLVPGAPFRPAKAGDRLVIYGVGFGQTTPVVPAGQITPGAAALQNLVLQLGGKPVATDYAGLAVGFVGLYQFNIVVPEGLSGDVAVTGAAGGLPITQGLALRVE